ncbi:hypothetical protein HEAR0632 [Herminiimonas arsenicoxydans]|uniref:Uncharacterized protein n=1 Tax=Herminiimonas arsenicoxydans TaxID=204773 RepID=A4G2U4_HERAR|nr:hypothetical protein HEAR0632 [Herminiimonas arsenicoxydans]
MQRVGWQALNGTLLNGVLLEGAAGQGIRYKAQYAAAYLRPSIPSARYCFLPKYQHSGEMDEWSAT